MRSFLAILLSLSVSAGAATLAKIDVLPSGATNPGGAVMQSGTTLSFSLRLTYSDNSTETCTTSCTVGTPTWSSSWPSRMTVSSSGVASAVQDPLQSSFGNDATNRYTNQFVEVSVGGVRGRSQVYTQHAGDSWTKFMTPQYNLSATNMVVGSRGAIGTGFTINNTSGGGNGFPIQELCDWESSNTAVATVDQASRVTAVSPGTATFTCNIAGNGSFVASTQGGWQFPGNYITLTVVAGPTASPVTHWVGNNGGTNAQCDGLSDADYPGTGTNQHCRLGEYAYLWSQNAWNISGGDIVYVKPDKQYVDGFISTGNCSGQNNYTCTSPTIPSGTPAHHTKILGANYANCHANSAKTVLYGTFGSYGWNVTDSQFVDVACFEFTDKAVCSTDSNFGSIQASYHCAGTDPFGTAAVTSDALSSASFTDIYTHGLAAVGWNGPTGPDVVMSYFNISGMPFAGVNMDSGPWLVNNIANAGGLEMDHSATLFSGCLEEYPITHNYPYVACLDANVGGYADGFGTANTSGDWVFDHDTWAFNFQDGLDLLHSAMKSVKITNSLSYANNGQQYKIGSGQSFIFANNVSINNCRRTEFLVGDEPASAKVAGVSGCRAGGDGVLMSVSELGATTLDHDTFIGGGLTAIDYVNESGVQSNPTANSTLINSLFVGTEIQNESGGNGPPNFLYTYDYTLVPTGVFKVHTNNIYFRNRGGRLSSDNASELSSDPLLVNEPAATVTDSTNFDNVSAALLSGSPAIGGGVGSSLTLTDLNGVTRSSPPAIGAVEYSSTPAPTAYVNTGVPQTVTNLFRFIGNLKRIGNLRRQ